MKKSELKTVSLSRIVRENLVTLMIMQPSTKMIKILIFGTYQDAWESAGLPSGRSRVQTPAEPTLRVFK